METALTVLIWVVISAIGILTLMLAAYIGVLTNTAEARSKDSHTETKFKVKS